MYSPCDYSYTQVCPSKNMNSACVQDTKPVKPGFFITLTRTTGYLKFTQHVNETCTKFQSGRLFHSQKIGPPMPGKSILVLCKHLILNYFETYTIMDGEFFLSE
jgi:hypothetical protein